MGKTPVFVAVGLVVGAVVIVWLRPSTEPSDESSAPALAADSGIENENAALVDRVAELEAQMSALAFAVDGLAERLAQEAERADTLDAERAALMRDIQQRLALSRVGAPGPGANAGAMPELPPGMEFRQGGFVIQSNGGQVRIAGPNGTLLTAEAVAAAAAAGQPMTAPPSLTGLQANTGQTLVFRVTGASEGPVWGTDVYTDDSSIAAAAVHAGILRPGETGTIMLTVREGFATYAPSSRNGIESASYGEWGRSFTMLRLN